MFRKMPFILIAIIFAILFLGRFIPVAVDQILYAISLSIKSLIIFLLPLIIFGLLFKAAVHLSHNATRFILLILVGVCCSNFISTFLSHYIGAWIYHFDLSITLPSEASVLKPRWFFEIPKIIANDKAMILGIVSGILMALFKKHLAHKIAATLEETVSIVLKGFIYLIPLFVTGFIVKLQFDGVINIIIKHYTPILLIIACAQFGYILLLYLMGSHFRLPQCLKNIRNILPASIAGFSTMSSAAAMPLTIIGAQKNAKNKDLARSVIPATVNIHLIGDCFAIPIFAYAVLKNYGMVEPGLTTYLIFTCYFVLAKFSVAAIPGGGILVMLPILESYLGFNAEMLSLITALYILFDPVITCANVFGNGAFAKIMDNLATLSFKMFSKSTRDPQKSTSNQNNLAN